MDEAGLWAKIDVRGPDECWPWMGADNGLGYGRAHWDGEVRYTHRIVEELTRGPIAPGVVVRHSCDNPPCCNPAHLLRGTQVDNARDAIERGRWRPGHFPGEANKQAKLTVSMVLAIRDECAAGGTHRAVARRYGMSHAQIGKIARRDMWATV